MFELELSMAGRSGASARVHYLGRPPPRESLLLFRGAVCCDRHRDRLYRDGMVGCPPYRERKMMIHVWEAQSGLAANPVFLFARVAGNG